MINILTPLQRLYQSGAGTSDGAAYQEYTLADSARVAKIPLNLTYEQAATIPLCLATAAIGMCKPESSELLANGFDVGGAGLTPPWVEGGMGKDKGQVGVVFRGSSSVGWLGRTYLFPTFPCN